MPVVVSPPAQKGIALLSVMLVFALVSLLTVHMIDDQYLIIRRTDHLITQDQAMTYAMSAEALAKRALYEDYKKDHQASAAVDGLQEDWQQVVSFPLEGGGIQAHLVDLQSRFNVNNIKQNKGAARTHFKNLITLLDPQADVEMIIDSLIQWMDEDDIPQGIGAEESYYLGLDPPYRAANRVFSHVSELLLIRGMTHELYQLLLPYVTALPEGVVLNLNTADPILLGSYPGVGDAKDLVELRSASIFTSVNSAFEHRAKPTDISGLAVSSEYFLLETDVVLGGQSFHFRSLIYRPRQITADNTLRVIQRDWGRNFAYHKL